MIPRRVSNVRMKTSCYKKKSTTFLTVIPYYSSQAIILWNWKANSIVYRACVFVKQNRAFRSYFGTFREFGVFKSRRTRALGIPKVNVNDGEY